MDDLQRYYKNSLMANLCQEYKGYWQRAMHDKEKLMRLVLMQQCAPHFADFCYRGEGLTKEYCKKEFGDYVNGRTFEGCDNVDGFTYAMYIDYEKELTLDVDVAQFLWCNDAYVTIRETKCPTLYVSNKSNVHITLDGFNSIRVYLFDESSVSFDDTDDDSSAVVFKYSKDASVEEGKYCLTSKIKVFDKELRL